MSEKILIKELQVQINKTFFSHSVIYLSDEAFRNMPDKCIFNVQYTFLGEKTVTKEHSASKQADKTKYKIQCGKDFTLSVASRAFGASKAAWYLSSNYNFDIGERLIFTVQELNEKYYLIAKGVYNLPDNEIVRIDGEEYTAKVLRKIANTFIPKYSGAKIPEKNKKDRVLWDNPTDWIKYDVDSDDYRQSLKVHNAVYMWIGHDSADRRLVYIGIVGDDNNISNSVGERIQQHVREKKLTIDYFRYCELVNCGNDNKVEILKTVEMQCINMVSGLIQGKHETIIHGKLKQTIIDDAQYEILMSNKTVRYQQGYGCGNLKPIS